MELDQPIEDNGDDVIDLYFTYEHIWYVNGEKQTRVLSQEKKTYVKGDRYEYEVKDFFDSGFVTKSGELLTGTALQDKCIVIEVYEVYNYASLLILSGTAVCEVSADKFISVGRNNECLVIFNDTGTDVQAFAIDVLDVDGVTKIGRYVVQDFCLSNGSYMVVFPYTGQFIGCDQTTNKRIMKQYSKFVEFYNECYSNY